MNLNIKMKSSIPIERWQASMTGLCTIEGSPTSDSFSKSPIRSYRPPINHLRRSKNKSQSFSIEGNAGDRKSIILSASGIETKKEASGELKSCPSQTDVLNQTTKKYGLLDGVLLRCLGNICGIIMFLRIGKIIGIGGLSNFLAAEVVSVLISFVTTLSLSAICTNGEVQGGGSYYLISRSMGPEFGGAIGIMYYLAITVAGAMYLDGFGETVMSQIGELPISIESDLQSGVIGFTTMMALFLFTYFFGMEGAVKMQLFSFVIMLIAFLTFTGVCVYQISLNIYANGPHVIYESLVANWTPIWNTPSIISNEALSSKFSHFDFSTVCNNLFPSISGILTGANIAHDLKNPSYSIPTGTLSAVAISALAYLIVGFLLSCLGTRGDQQGLLFDDLIIGHVVMWPCYYIIYCGMYAATLGSAVCSIISAPRLLEAISNDKLFSVLNGLVSQPKYTLLKTFSVTGGIISICLLSGGLASDNSSSIDFIAPLNTIFFLSAYAMINYACFVSRLSGSPGWRPLFTFYNQWVSAFGAALCFFMILYLNLPVGFLTIMFGCILYSFVASGNHKDNISWGSASDGVKYNSAFYNLLNISDNKMHVKNFRPQFLVLCGEEDGNRNEIISFTGLLKKGKGMAIFATIVNTLPHIHYGKDEIDQLSNAQIMADDLVCILKTFGVKGFTTTSCANNMRDGALKLMECSGIGAMKPNTLIIGFLKNWKKALMKHNNIINRNSIRHSEELNEDNENEKESDIKEDKNSKIDDYVGVIGDAFDMNFGVVLFRAKNDYSFVDEVLFSASQKNSISLASSPQPKSGSESNNEIENNKLDCETNRVIDIWWLTDDGGLILLLAYLVNNHKLWRKAKLRVMVIHTDSLQLGREQIKMEGLLRKFRIDAEVYPILDSHPIEPIDKKWLDIIKDNEIPMPTTALEIRTKKVCRTAELINDYSAKSSLVFISLPVPSVSVPASLYMAWIDLISDIPPPVELCVICTFGDFTTADPYCKACDQQFHFKCVCLNWIAKYDKSSCPLCRAMFIESYHLDSSGDDNNIEETKN